MKLASGSTTTKYIKSGTVVARACFGFLDIPVPASRRLYYPRLDAYLSWRKSMSLLNFSSGITGTVVNRTRALRGAPSDCIGGSYSRSYPLSRTIYRSWHRTIKKLLNLLATHCATKRKCNDTFLACWKRCAALLTERSFYSSMASMKWNMTVRKGSS